MAINFTVSYTFTPNTVISSSQVNTNFSDNSNVWTGLEAKTKSFSALVVDATPTSATDVAIKSYVDKLNNYRRPVLQYSSVTVVNLETGINGTSGQAQILFPDGTLRTDSTASRINFDITRNCALSGSAQSGLRATLSEAANTRYALYAVKVSDSSTNFVVVGDTVFPIQANYTTLNSNFGSNSWIYLGYVWNGNGQAGNSDIVKFVQSGNMTTFYNANAVSVITVSGIQMASTAGAVTLTYTYSAGSTSADIPNTIGQVLWQVSYAAVNDQVIAEDSAAAFKYRQVMASNKINSDRFWGVANQGIKLSNAAASSIAYDILVAGYVDTALGVGANPLL
jgi:hypothetical protein